MPAGPSGPGRSVGTRQFLLGQILLGQGTGVGGLASGAEVSRPPPADRGQPTRCPTGFGPAPLTEVMYTGRDSVEAWITWPPPMYNATWLTGE